MLKIMKKTYLKDINSYISNNEYNDTRLIEKPLDIK